MSFKVDNTVSDEELQNFKQALYIDGDEDNLMISDYIVTARQYVTDAVSQDTDLSEYQQFEFAVQMLAQFWYQNRGIDMNQTPYQVVSMIQQLRAKIDQ